ncbi:MAG: SGNH/GDSL hydrolase family protein [Clostridia bacterium]|nr:SGNH/GDSL hydrolase family protein [Clostridia bacterium]
MTDKQNGVSQNELNNNVSARGQLGANRSVRFEGKAGGLRLLCVGNSITWHGYKEDIGWLGDWGMAASAKEKDYVHRLADKLSRKYGDVEICIAQLAEWECGYAQGPSLLEEKWNEARDFAADIVVIRLGENMKRDAAPACKPDFEKMIQYFLKNERALVVVSDDFWKNDVRDAMIREIAEEQGYAFCHIGDLEDDPRTMAIDEYEHRGVGLHPSDYGMELIAQRLFDVIVKNFDGKEK